MKALITTRFSDQVQIGGVSTEMQLNACRDYCQNKGIKIIAEDIVEAQSATASNTKRIARMLDFCKKYKGKTELLLAYKLDRISRDTATYFYLKSELLKLGITIKSATEQFVGDDNPASKFIETVLVGAAQFDNDIKSERVKSSFKTLLERGICPWSKCRGYKPHKNALGRVDIPEIDNEYGLADGIQEIFDKFLHSGMAQAEISKHMTSKKIRNYKGKPVIFSKQLINNILRNKFYIGMIEVKKWNEVYQGKHQPIVDIKIFNQVQQILSPEKTIKHKQINPDFPLKDRLYCGLCDKRMTAAWCTGGSGQKHPLYYCYNSKCPNQNKRSINKINFENEFFDYLKHIKPKKDKVDRFVKKVLIAYKNRKVEFETKSGQLRKQLNQLESEKQEIVKLMAKKIITPEDGQTTLNDYTKKINEAKLELSESFEQEFQVEYLTTFAKKFFEILPQLWANTQNADLKIQLQRMILPQKIIYSYPSFFQTEISPIFRLIEEHGTKSSNLVSPSIKLSNENMIYFFTTLKSWQESKFISYQF